MRETFHLIPILIIITIASLVSYFWFADLTKIGLDADEVMWVIHSQFYRYRQQGMWDKFATPQGYPYRYTWSSISYQVIDQPQLGKYIFGFILDISGKLTWDAQEKNWLYADFPSNRIPGGQSLQFARSKIGADIVESILIMRYVSAFAGLLSLAIFGYLVSKFTNILVGTLATATAASYPLMRYNLRIATTNSVSLLFLILTVILMIWLLKNYKTMSVRNLIASSLLLGALNACATSVKLNGTFLILFPAIYISIAILRNNHRPKKQKGQITLKKSALLLASYFGSYFAMFYFLEPELWANLFTGIKSLYGSRLRQQEMFYNFYGKRSLMTMPLVLFKVFLNRSTNVLSMLLAASLVLIGIKGLIKQRESNSNNQLVLWMLIYILLANTYYARIDFHGFDRYLIPSILVLILLISIGAYTIILGFIEIFTKRSSLAKKYLPFLKRS